MKAKLSKIEPHYFLIVDGKTFGSTMEPHLSASIRHSLSLKNCQAIERGYDLDELADEYAYNNVPPIPGEYQSSKYDFKKGFQKALELMGDKKFTEEDVRCAMDRVWDWYNDEEDVECPSIKDLKNKHIQSLQQNEWEVEIVREDNFESDGIEIVNIPKPKLDADGRIILKRVTD